MNLLVSVPRLAGFSLITLIGAEVGDDTTSTASVRVLKAPMETLLPRRSPRSDDLERGDPGPPLHPITGTFADATHAKDFAARCFRLAFHLHAPLLAAFVVTDTYFLSVCTAPSITGFANLLVDGTLLLLRIGLHRSSDHSRAQQLGSAAWALYVVAFPLAARLDPGYMAGTPGMGPGAAIVFGFGLALLNSSHGLSFAHMTTLALVLLLTPPIVLALVLHPVAHFFNPVAAVTRATVRMTLSVTVYCWSFAAGHVCAHVMERLAARLYLTHEQLQEGYQRLHYDLQNPARPPEDRRRVARGLLATRRPGASDVPSASASAGPASSSTSSSSRRVSFAAPDPQAAASPPNDAAVAGPLQGASAAPALLHEAAPTAAGPSTTYDGATQPTQPLFTMSAAHRSSWLQAAAAAQLAEAAAAREEELSDAASLPEHATAQLNAEAAAEMWSSSDESSGAHVRRGMRRAKFELRHGTIGYAIDGRHIAGIDGLPFITHTQHDLDGLPGYSSHGRRAIARRQAALRNCPYN